MDVNSLLWCLALFCSPGYIRYSLDTIKRSRYGLQHDLLVLICMLAQVHVLFYSGSLADEVSQNINYHKQSFPFIETSNIVNIILMERL